MSRTEVQEDLFGERAKCVTFTIGKFEVIRLILRADDCVRKKSQYAQSV